MELLLSELIGEVCLHIGKDALLPPAQINSAFRRELLKLHGRLELELLDPWCMNMKKATVLSVSHNRKKIDSAYEKEFVVYENAVYGGCIAGNFEVLSIFVRRLNEEWLWNDIKRRILEVAKRSIQPIEYRTALNFAISSGNPRLRDLIETQRQRWKGRTGISNSKGLRIGEMEIDALSSLISTPIPLDDD